MARDHRENRYGGFAKKGYFRAVMRTAASILQPAPGGGGSRFQTVKAIAFLMRYICSCIRIHKYILGGVSRPRRF